MKKQTNRPTARAANDDLATGDTRVATDDAKQGNTPRLPHERDESSDSQVDRAPADQSRQQKAHDDVERGVVDTDKGPVIDQVYEKVRGGDSTRDRK